MSGITGGPFVVATLIKVAIFFTAMMLAVMLATIVERKVAGFIQDRSGPNRVGPWGMLQVIADGIKNIIKEETMPAQ
ncbi:MAG: NADH-quinone oxidoreductase subunit H, partial [Gemmatimonadetes bacterium]|nr:NADH-quinone oxidoreductase subunit H [Gemmatimonadota bacterium]